MLIMKKIAFTLILTLITLTTSAQNLVGAWESEATTADGNIVKLVLIITDNYLSKTTYNTSTNDFLSTSGGSYELEGNRLTEWVEFDSGNPEAVGTEISSILRITDSEIVFLDGHMKVKRIDDGTPGALQGAWLMSGRTIDGDTQIRDTNTPRKTMKILSGTRFQWIAYNTETKQFMATGGGTYTTVDGKYTESIEFFSRDSSRVGLQLEFNYNLRNGHWHHTGFSTKGDPIDEIWSKRK